MRIDRAVNWSALALSCAALMGCAPESGDPELAAVRAAFVGTWTTSCSPSPMADGTMAWSTYRVTNDGVRGSLRVSLFGDAACTFALADFLLESRQVIGDLVPAAGPGAREYDVYFEHQSVTAHVQGFLDSFRGAGCGTGPYALDQAIDTSATGCFTFQSIMSCNADYDLIRVDGDRFYNGVRGGNMCQPEGRPTTLNPFWFDRVR